jgi:hypothetical protein
VVEALSCTCGRSYAMKSGRKKIAKYNRIQGGIMRFNRSKYQLTVPILFYALIVFGCATLISQFDQMAYENAVNLKVEALRIMDKAVGPYSEHEEKIEEIILKVEKAYEYAKGLPKNEISTRQWQILKDPERNLWGGFIKRWKENSTLGEVYIQEKKKQVSEAFDYIIGLESGKIKPSEIR